MGRVLICRLSTKHSECFLSLILMMSRQSLLRSKARAVVLQWKEQVVFSTSLATMFQLCKRKACTKGLAESPQLWLESGTSSSNAQMSCSHAWDLNNLFISFLRGSSMWRKALAVIRLKLSSCLELTRLLLLFKPGQKWTTSGRM